MGKLHSPQTDSPSCWHSADASAAAAAHPYLPQLLGDDDEALTLVLTPVLLPLPLR
jgi:hypothetical protein